MRVSFTSSAAMWHRMAETTKLLFKSARVNIEFTKDGWKQLLQQNTSPVSAFIQSINIKADLALYIVAHEDKGIFMDTECQAIRYQSGLFLIIREGQMSVLNLLVFIGHLASAAISLLLFRWQSSLRHRIFRNLNGRPGPEI